MAPNSIQDHTVLLYSWGQGILMQQQGILMQGILMQQYLIKPKVFYKLLALLLLSSQTLTKAVLAERRMKWNKTSSSVFQHLPPCPPPRAKATTGEKELQLGKDLFFLAINLIPLFLCPTKHDKVLFHKVFSIRATKLPQSVAICFYHNCCSWSRESRAEKGHHC